MNPITRINFFDGLFLRQQEFLAEQLYHLHMRRRMNFMLFDGSGVVQVELGDLRISPTSPPADKTFRVTAGMALSHRPDLAEGREIVLAQDSEVFDLAALGFAQAFVAIHYEDALIEPQTGVEPATETRVEETAVVTVHDAAAAWPPAEALPGSEQYVLLGRITLADMAVDDSQRQTATLRSALIGVPATTLLSIAVTPASPNLQVGQTQQLTATGSFSDGTSAPLTGADGLVWTSDAAAVASVDANGLVTANAPGSTAIDATAQSVSDAATVTVAAALGIPTIDPWPSNNDRRRHGTETLTVFGDQFGAPMQVSFLAANGIDRVLANASVTTVNEATVVVPGPFTPTSGDPAVVRSGRVRVITPAGESTDSPQNFILETV